MGQVVSSSSCAQVPCKQVARRIAFRAKVQKVPLARPRDNRTVFASRDACATRLASMNGETRRQSMTRDLERSHPLLRRRGNETARTKTIELAERDYVKSTPSFTVARRV